MKGVLKFLLLLFVRIFLGFVVRSVVWGIVRNKKIVWCAGVDFVYGGLESL